MIFYTATDVQDSLISSLAAATRPSASIAAIVSLPPFKRNQNTPRKGSRR
jgi:hypothetical protein